MLEFSIAFAKALIEAGPWGIALILILLAFTALVFLAWFSHKTHMGIMDKHAGEAKQFNDNLTKIIDRNTEAFVKHAEVMVSVTNAVDNCTHMVEKVYDKLDR